MAKRTITQITTPATLQTASAPATLQAPSTGVAAKSHGSALTHVYLPTALLTILGGVGGAFVTKKIPTSVGTGVGAGVGGLSLGVSSYMLLRARYLESLPNDPVPPPGRLPEVDYGSMRRPTNQAAELAQARDASKLPTRTPTRYGGSPGSLKIKIKKPECEIVYNEDYYTEHQFTRLAAEYDSGDKISHKRANQIMEWYAKDGPAIRMRDNDENMYDRVGSTGDFYYKYLGLDVDQAYAASLGSHSSAWWKVYFELEAATKGFGQPTKFEKVVGNMTVAETKTWLKQSEGTSKGASASDAEDFLVSHGYTLVDADCDKVTRLENLTPGWYQIIAKPIWQESDQYWRFLAGYWKWTKYGPRGKKGSTVIDRFMSGDHCTNDLTYFDRIIGADRWADISRLVEVVPHQTTHTYFKPLVTLEVTDCGTKTNSYSKTFNALCASYKISKLVITKVYGGAAAFIIYILENFIGELLQISEGGDTPWN